MQEDQEDDAANDIKEDRPLQTSDGINRRSTGAAKKYSFDAQPKIGSFKRQRCQTSAKGESRINGLSSHLLDDSKYRSGGGGGGGNGSGGGGGNTVILENKTPYHKHS